MIKVKRYRTYLQCLAAYHGCRPSEVPHSGYWEYHDGKRMRRTSQKICIRWIRSRGCWGWCEGKKVIHLWFTRKAKFEDVISLIAHELGHIQKPWGTRAKEEKKANLFEFVARDAVKIYKAILSGKKLVQGTSKR
jgi:hypothetical protein